MCDTNNLFLFVCNCCWGGLTFLNSTKIPDNWSWKKAQLSKISKQRIKLLRYHCVPNYPATQLFEQLLFALCWFVIFFNAKMIISLNFREYTWSFPNAQWRPSSITSTRMNSNYALRRKGCFFFCLMYEHYLNLIKYKDLFSPQNYCGLKPSAPCHKYDCKCNEIQCKWEFWSFVPVCILARGLSPIFLPH